MEIGRQAHHFDRNVMDVDGIRRRQDAVKEYLSWKYDLGNPHLEEGQALVPGGIAHVDDPALAALVHH